MSGGVKAPKITPPVRDKISDSESHPGMPTRPQNSQNRNRIFTVHAVRRGGRVTNPEDVYSEEIQGDNADHAVAKFKARYRNHKDFDAIFAQEKPGVPRSRRQVFREGGAEGTIALTGQIHPTDSKED